MIETALVGKQALSDYPSVLGESHPGEVAQPPEIRFTKVDSGVRFTPTSCGIPSMRSVSIAAVTQPLGTGTITVEGEDITLGRDVPYFGKSNSVRLGTGVTSGHYVIALSISEAAAKQIQEREHEHVDDFTAAFALSFQALTDAINRLASRTFSGATRQEAQNNALRELAEIVPYLVPSQPDDLSAWTGQVKRVYAALAGLSTVRDGRDPNGGSQAQDYPHKVTWYAEAETPAGNGKTGQLLITPRVGPAGISASALVTVDAAKADKSLGSWTSLARPQSDRARDVPFSVNTRVRITRDFVVDGKTLPMDCTGEYYGKREDTEYPLEFYFELPEAYESKDFHEGYTTDVFPWDILDFVEEMAGSPAKGEEDSPTPDYVSQDEEDSPPQPPGAQDQKGPTGSVQPANDDEDDLDALLRQIAFAAAAKKG